MCGYVFVSSRNQITREIDANVLQHRGPDHTKEIDLGWCRVRHWRLSIQDLTSHSNQPYSDQVDYLVYNGELYDFRNVASRIFSKLFDSDTQFLFHALKKNCFELIKNLSGFYSFVFIKHLEKRFFSTRDYFGKKPLYYYFDSDLLVVASEDRAVKDIAQKYGRSIKIKPASIFHYICYKDLHFGNTYYDNIYELAPGSFLEFDFETWTLSISKSWEDYYVSKPFYKEEKFKKVANDTSERVLQQSIQHLINSIEKRFIADVPVWLALSGGVDSTLLALIAKEKKKNFDSVFTVSSKSRPSELEKSKILCDTFSINQHIIDFDSVDFFDLLRKAIYAQAAPLSHPHALALFALTKEVSRIGKVLITGEGADELFYGYEHYKHGNTTFAFLKHINPHEYFDDDGKTKGLFKNFELEKYLENNDSRDLDVKTHLLSLLRRNDRVSMRNSIELRSAYLDFELFQFISQAQENCSLPTGKDLAVKMIKDIFPRYEIDRRKIGFYVPFDDWFETHRNNDVLVKRYIDNANSFLKMNFGLTLKKNAQVKGKLAWALLNIGVFHEVWD